MDADLPERVAKLEQSMPDYADDLRRALQYVEGDAESALGKCRVCTDRLLEEIASQYRHELPQKSNPLDDPVIAGALGRSLLGRMRLIREFGNHALHGKANKEQLWPEDAELALALLCDVLERWHMQSPRRAGWRRVQGGGEREDSAPNRFQNDPSGARRTTLPPVTSPSRGRGRVIAAALVLALGLGVLGFRLTRSVTPGPEPSANHPAGSSGAPPVVSVSSVAPIPAARPEAMPPSSSERPAPPVAGPDDLTWTQQKNSVSGDLHAVVSDSRGHIYAVGEHGVVVNSRDGGRTWHPIPTGKPITFRAVAVNREGRVFAAGDQGTLLLSKDPLGPNGRAAWDHKIVGEKSNLRSACEHPSGDVFVAGDYGVIVHLAPDGRTLKLTQIANQPTIWQVSAARDQSLYAAGDAGTLLHARYSAKGTEWQPLKTGEQGPLWAVTEEGGRLLIGGQFSQRDNGRDIKVGFILQGTEASGFIRSRLPEGPPNPVYGFARARSGELYAAVYSYEKPYLLHSSDGSTWKRSLIEGGAERLHKARYAIAASPLGDLFIVGPKGLILHKRTTGDARTEHSERGAP